MVRINIVSPEELKDQHLIAEYNEILMLFGHVRKYPEVRNQPKEYCLGEGHINFFKDKLKYLKERHELLKKEMRRRGFRAEKSVGLSDFPGKLKNNWKPKEKDFEIIRARLREKMKSKPGYYRYFGKVSK